MVRGLYCHVGVHGPTAACVRVCAYVCVFRGLCHLLPDTMPMSMACAAAEGSDVPVAHAVAEGCVDVHGLY